MREGGVRIYDILGVFYNYSNNGKCRLNAAKIRVLQHRHCEGCCIVKIDFF